MKKVSLSQNKFALVDDVGYEQVSKWKWYCSPRGYAVREAYVAGSGRANRQRYTIFMHRLIMGEPAGLEVDHINRNKLDNRRENLRPCTHAENSQNMSRHRDNKSGYVGVFWNSQKSKYTAKITRYGKQYYAGSFNDALEASRARNDELDRLKVIAKERGVL